MRERTVDDRFRRTPQNSGWCDQKKLPKGPNGRNLCRECATEVTPPRLTFCSKECVEAWKIRTQPGFAKLKVLERDDGICVACGIDTLADLRELMKQHPGRYRHRLCARFDMDHRRPVVMGGGSCDLSNLRTLCKPCHKLVTAELARRRAAKRRRAKASTVSD